MVKIDAESERRNESVEIAKTFRCCVEITSIFLFVCFVLFCFQYYQQYAQQFSYIYFYCFRCSMVETTLWKKPSLEILPWSKRGRLTKLETLFSGTNYFFNIYLSLKLSCSFSRNGRLEQCQDLCYHI